MLPLLIILVLLESCSIICFFPDSLFSRLILECNCENPAIKSDNLGGKMSALPGVVLIPRIVKHSLRLKVK